MVPGGGGVGLAQDSGTRHAIASAAWLPPAWSRAAVLVTAIALQQLFGHADIRSVQTYARIEDGTLREAMARLHPTRAEE